MYIIRIWLSYYGGVQRQREQSHRKSAMAIQEEEEEESIEKRRVSSLISFQSYGAAYQVGI